MADITRLKKNLTDSLSHLKSTKMIPPEEGETRKNLGMKVMFDEYANKMLEYVDIADEIDWNELTASEFVTSIQTTIGKL